MPGTWQLSDDQIDGLVDFVRSLGQVEPQPLPGDAERGASVYDDNSCEACHVLAGRGRGLGPELTRIGLMRGLEHLRESLLEPQKHVAEEYLFLRAHFPDGSTLEGLRLNEDAFSLQIRDASGRFHSLAKPELTRLERLRNRTIMRSYRRSLNEAELNDLVSFLASQRGPTSPEQENAP